MGVCGADVDRVAHSHRALHFSQLLQVLAGLFVSLFNLPQILQLALVSPNQHKVVELGRCEFKRFVEDGTKVH